MKRSVLVSCEESQRVTIALRNEGIEAWSCDILPPSGGHSEWHLQEDVIPLLKKDWRALIAFPPCTHLATSGARWFKQKQADGRQQQGIDFFMAHALAKIPLICIENPVGIMSTRWREPDQIVHPWWFGDPFSKRTCLWLKGFPPLKPIIDINDSNIDKGEFVDVGKGRKMAKWYNDAWKLPKEERSKARSKTFPGLAEQMAKQWKDIILGN